MCNIYIVKLFIHAASQVHNYDNTVYVYVYVYIYIYIYDNEMTEIEMTEIEMTLDC